MAHHGMPSKSFEFSLNVFTEFAEINDKNISHNSKRVQTCHPANSCVRDQDATTASATTTCEKDWIFKLSTVIYHICWIQWIPAPLLVLAIYHFYSLSFFSNRKCKKNANKTLLPTVSCSSLRHPSTPVIYQPPPEGWQSNSVMPQKKFTIFGHQ